MILLGQKRKRGRPSKAKRALLVQENFHTVGSISFSVRFPIIRMRVFVLFFRDVTVPVEVF